MESGNPKSDAVKLVAQKMLSSDKIAVLEHEKPDGDCIGSGLALVLGLRSLGKKAILISQDAHPQVYHFLSGSQYYTRSDYIQPEEFNPDLAVFLDCTGPDRVGKSLSLVEGKPWINIDHHISNSYFGHLNLVDPHASAVGELVFQILECLGVEITQEMAEAIYVAIATDTGGFRYQNTTSDTLRLAARLLDIGVKAWEISDMVFEQRTLSYLMLLAQALNSLRLYQGGRVAAISVTKEMLRKAGASQDEAEGLVNYPRSIQGVEVALAFKESDNAKIHVSFRSRKRVDVAEVASRFGGGGHPRAAGAVLDGTLDEVQKKVLNYIDSLEVWKDL